MIFSTTSKNDYKVWDQDPYFKLSLKTKKTTMIESHIRKRGDFFFEKGVKKLKKIKGCEERNDFYPQK